MNRRFILATLRREARASRRRFLLYGGCMTLGIATLVGLHGLRTLAEAAVEAQSQRLLGADLRLASRADLDDDQIALVAQLEQNARAPVAHVTRFGSMALAPRAGRTRLVDVQAVGPGFPFHGAVITDPPGLWSALEETEHAALVDGSLLIQLDARLGDELRLGQASFRIVGAVTRAPGSFGLRSQVAPRVYIARRHVDETGLVQTGSMVDHLVYVNVAEEPLREWLDARRPALDAGRIRIQTLESYREELSTSVGALTRFLGLLGLAALALGGVGVAAGMRVFVREKLDTVAVLRSLGARPRDVVAAYGLLTLALGAAAGLLGAALGGALQWMLPALVEGLLPIEIEPGVDPLSIATGIVLGIWVTALFGAGPLIDLARVPPLRALRRDFASEPQPREARTALIVALAVTLLGTSLWQAEGLLQGLAFAGGLGAALALLAAAATGASAWLRRHRPRRGPYWLRQGIANLFRPRNHTVATTLSIGFGLFLIGTLHSVQYNVMRQIELDAGRDRPNLVLFDIQREQVASLETFLAERDASILERAPIISARIAHLAGRPTGERLGGDELDRDQRWALRREYRLTYAADLRPSEELVEGSWWTGDSSRSTDPVPVSLDTEIAATLGVGVGDRVGWEIQGVPLESVVRSLRDIDWRRLGTNFFAVFPPSALQAAPQTTVLLVRVEDAGERAALQRDLVARFPNVAALDATLILRALEAMMNQTRAAVRLLAIVTLTTGLLLLVAATATSRHERSREVLLLRTLGASSGTVRRIVATEAAALGALAVGIGTGLALIAAWALVHFVFDLPFSPPWLDLGGLALLTLLVSTVIGAGDGRAARSRSPLAGLREIELTGAG